MADRYGGRGFALPGGRWASGSRWMGRVACFAVVAVALPGSVLAGTAGASGRGFSWTPSKTEPYSVCGRPEPGQAACLAIAVPSASALSSSSLLRPVSPVAVNPTYTGTGVGGGYGPSDLRSAYNLPSSTAGSGQTVGIVDAYNDPDAESDLAAYRSQYGLSACTTANGCFKKVNQTGGTTYPANEASWSVEISLDVDMVSAACPNCHILLVEATSATSANLYASEDEAAALGATEISNSWVGGEESGETSEDKYFDHPGVPITAGAGDSGYQVNYPASSQYVIAVGGTKLTQASNSRGWSETVWSEKPTQGTGSGCSAYEPKPSWQTDKGCTHKTNNDVAADASVETPLSVADSYELPTKFAERSPQPGWTLVGGTSAATPLVAGAMALASPYTRSLVGGHAFYLEQASGGGINDVVSGSDGKCTPPAEHEYLCTAGVGYDGPTGVGTPWGAPQAPPTVVTKAGSSITATSATISATVNPNGGSVSECLLEYGTTTSYGSSAPCTPSPGAGESAVAVSAALSGLVANTSYHFRISATNTGGTSKGADETFKTTEAPTVAPTVVTKAATSVKSTTATATATVNPNSGEVSKCEFEYGTSISYGQTASCAALPGGGSSAVEVTAALSGLAANTTYHFRISATNAGGTSKGSDETFKTLPNAPTVVTKAATSIKQTTATATATVNPNSGEVSECKFEYGTSISYGQVASCASLPGSGSSPVEVTAALSGLTANTTYHFRISATNAAGVSKGADETLLTLPNAPTVVTKAASPIGQSTATLTGTVNPNGGEVTKCEFEYGTTVSYGSTAPCSPAPGSGTSAVAVSAAITGLSANTTYHFRISATNAGGTSKGSDETLKTTANAPTVVTKAASPIAQTTATLNATVNPNGAEVTKCEFEYGTTISYGSIANCSALPGSGSSAVAVSAAVTGLAADTTYHFRISASNAGATSKGSDETFTTLPSAPTVAICPAFANRTEAALCAKVNPNGGEVSECKFEYGPTNSYGSSVPCEPKPGSGTNPIEVEGEISGLTVNTTYHYRIVATNPGGTTKGTDETFKTLPNPPTVVTGSASPFAQTTATLNGTVNPNGAEVTECKLEWGTTNSYGSTQPCSPAPGSGTSPVAVSAAITGLAPNTTYRFRVVATNAGGVGEGSEGVFKTLPNPPTVVTKAATSVKSTTATATATVNPNSGEVSKCEFEYGTSISYGQTASCAALPGGGSSPVEVTAALSGLTANTTYHYRISATNAGGTSKGSDETFKTLPSLQITTASLPGGFLGAPYSQTLQASGGITPYTWSITSGTLPTGLTLNPLTGAITGTPTAAGLQSFTVKVTDSSLPTAQTASANLSIDIAEPTYTTAIASYQEPEARFSEPNAVAVDPSGDIFIADSGHDRIVELNSERKFLRQWGEAGSGEGQFNGIGGIATNSSGDLYVSDEGNNRIQEFGPSGEYLRSFGGGTILTPGPLSLPAAIAVDSSGNVWVLNAYGSPEGGRIAEFSATGTLITKFGSTGSTEGKIGIASFGLAISGGNLYVAEYGNQRVQEFSTSGTFLATFDPAGSGTGESNEPWGIATDPSSGNLYVSEVGNDRVQEFSSEGAFVTAFGSAGSGSGQFSAPRGVAVGPTGQVFIADSGNLRVEQWAPGAPPTYTTAIASYENPEARFSEPNAVAIDPSGDIFIADSGHDRIVELNSERKFLRQWGEAGSGEGQFNGIGGIATNSSGDLYVSDEGNNRIQEFGPSGEYLRSFGGGTILTPGPLSLPAAIAVDSSGNVWVLNAYGSPEGGRIAEFSATGTLITKFGSTGSTEGKIGIASFGLAISGGNLYVAEYGNQRVQEFSTSGTFLATFDPAGSGTGESNEPWSIATDPTSGNLYVSELGADRVQEFSAAGAFISAFGSQGSGAGQLQSPRGLAVSSSGQIFIADTGNARVEEWGPP